jgi:hypothetical protein
MIWRRTLNLVGILATTVVLVGSSQAGAAGETHTVTYGPLAPATTAQLRLDAQSMSRQLGRLGASFVHVGVSNGEIVLSASRSISSSLLNELGQTTELYIRPVLCFAAAQQVPQGSTSQSLPRGSGSVPPCAPANQLTAANLDINFDTGEPTNKVGPDPQYAADPSTSVDMPDYADSTVLLPGVNKACNDQSDVRCVLGPEELTGRSIASATATRDQTGAWVVDYTMAGAAGSALWDKVAQENFHQMIGIELDGVVYSAPIIQPTQSSFTSFDGKGEISGSLTKNEAQELARTMNLSLAVPLKLLGQSSASGAKAQGS